MPDDAGSIFGKGNGRSGRRRLRSYPAVGRAMPFKDWPAADRAAWEAAVAPGADVLDEPGAAAHLAPGTREVLTRTYGQFLMFLDLRGELDRAASPATRATPERVGAWLNSLKPRLRATAVRRMLIGLSIILAKMVPDRDWSWIRRHPARPSPAEVRASRKPIDTFDPAQLEVALRARIARCAEQPRTPAQARVMRDLVLTRVAIYTGLRLRNLARLRLGQQLRDDGECFMIRFEANETKTGRPIDFQLAEAATPALRDYVEAWRPVLLNGEEDTGHLCVAAGGRPVCDATVSRVIQHVTGQLIGRAINPHLIRHTMATGLLLDNPLALRTAAAALGHSSSRSVNEVYDRSGSACSASSPPETPCTVPMPTPINSYQALRGSALPGLEQPPAGALH